MARLTPKQLASLILRYTGWRGSQAATAIAIAMSESGINTQAHAGGGENSWGIWQINLNAHGSWVSQSCVTDPVCSTKAAFRIFNRAGGSFNPWSVYSVTGRYRSNLPVARQALGLASRGGGGGDQGFDFGAFNQRQKKQQKQNLRQSLEDLLGGLGVGSSPEMKDLIDNAIRADWSIQRFESELVGTKVFQRQFPGLTMASGRINPFLLPSFGGGLAEAVGRYRDLTMSYQKAIDLVNPKVNLTRKRVGMLIVGQKSPEEFATGLRVIEKARNTPGLMQKFNAQLKLRGKKPLDRMGWFKFLARAAEANLYDIYEGALLDASQLNIGKKAAARLAGQIEPSEGTGPTDIDALIAPLFGVRTVADIGPELRQVGISDVDLVRFAAGIDPGGKVAGKIKQLQAQRQLLSQGPLGTQLQRTASGGIGQVGQQQDIYGVD